MQILPSHYYRTVRGKLRYVERVTCLGNVWWRDSEAEYPRSICQKLDEFVRRTARDVTDEYSSQ